MSDADDARRAKLIRLGLIDPIVAADHSCDGCSTGSKFPPFEQVVFRGRTWTLCALCCEILEAYLSDRDPGWLGRVAQRIAALEAKGGRG